MCSLFQLMFWMEWTFRATSPTASTTCSILALVCTATCRTKSSRKRRWATIATSSTTTGSAPRGQLLSSVPGPSSPAPSAVCWRSTQWSASFPWWARHWSSRLPLLCTTPPESTVRHLFILCFSCLFVIADWTDCEQCHVRCSLTSLLVKWETLVLYSGSKCVLHEYLFYLGIINVNFINFIKVKLK